MFREGADTTTEYYVPMNDPWYAALGACPDCGSAILLRSDAECACGFRVRGSVPLDVRPQAPRPRTQVSRIGFDAAQVLAGLDIDRPASTYDGPKPARDSSELFSAVASSLVAGASLLDLGCGPRDQQPAAAHYGVHYVGIDYTSSAADLLADAHALPFQDGTFDLVLSYAVMEHLYNPFLAASEIARVLRPGGIFFGTVSQGEPFHDSFFHHTAFGVLAALGTSNLQALRLWPSYDTLRGLSEMGRYAYVIRQLIKGVHLLDRAFPFLAPRAYFKSPRERALERLYRAASIAFVAIKP